VDLSSLLWLFIILAAIQPIIRQKMLERARVRVLRQFEKSRGSRVIVLIHRQETMRILGFPLVRYIDINDSEAVLRAIKLTDDEVPIDLVLHTPGGLVLAADQIASALRRHPARVTVFVPHYAMSGGTMIALAADEIVLDDNAVLGPIDPQIGQQPAVSILKVLQRKEINEVDDATIILADIAEKAIRQVKTMVLELLGDRLPPEQAERTAAALAGGGWTHDYPIHLDEARALNLAVSTELPQAVYDLMDLHPQAAQRRPSVEYIPAPYGPPSVPRERKTP